MKMQLKKSKMPNKRSSHLGVRLTLAKSSFKEREIAQIRLLMLPDAKLTGCEAIRMAIVGMQTITGIDAVVYVA